MHCFILIVCLLATTVKTGNAQVKFGFFETSLTLQEREEPYTVDMGYITGSRRPVPFSIVLEYDTADESDIVLITSGGFVTNFNRVVSISFQLPNDLIAEGLETVTLRVVPGGIVNPATDFDEFCDTLQISIEDREVVSFSFQFSEDDYRATEMPNAMMPVRITRSPPDVVLANPVTFSVTPLTVQQALDLDILPASIPADQPSAYADSDDFDTTVLTVTFPADEVDSPPVLSVPAPIPVVDDELNEATQYFVVQLQLLEPHAPNIVLERGVAACIIEDNDPIELNFAQATYEFQEPEVAPTVINDVIITRNASTEQIFLVGVSVSDPVDLPAAQLFTLGNAEIADFDISLSGNPFVTFAFPPSAESAVFHFTLLPDLRDEGVEAFQANIVAVSDFPPETIAPAGGFVPYVPGPEAVVRIRDANVVVVGFEESSYTAKEGDGSVEVCVVITRPTPDTELSSDVSLTYSTFFGSAAPGEDYSEVEDVALTFPASSGSGTPRRMCLQVAILDDFVIESDEFFLVTLVPDSQPGFLPVSANPAITRVTITDNDDPAQGGIKFGFIETNMTGTERTTPYEVEVGYISDTVIDSNIMFSVELIPQTAGSSDVNLILSSGFIPAGSSSRFTISFILRLDSVAQESDETFQLKLNVSMENIERSLLGVLCDTMTVTIRDADLVSFQLTEDDYRAAEYELMPVAVTKNNVQLANPVSFTITPLTVSQALDKNIISDFIPENFDSPNRANEDDFNPNAFTVTFLADEGSPAPVLVVPAPVALTNDNVNEASEQYFIAHLQLESAVRPDLVELGRVASTCIIDDNDDIEISFTQAVHEFMEPDFGTTSHRLAIVRNRDTEQTIFVGVLLSEPTGPIPPAQLFSQETADSADYSIGSSGNTFITIFYLTSSESVNFGFMILADSRPEGVEAFVATILPIDEFPQNTGGLPPPTNGYNPYTPGMIASAEVRIRDMFGPTIIEPSTMETTTATMETTTMVPTTTMGTTTMETTTMETTTMETTTMETTTMETTTMEATTTETTTMDTTTMETTTMETTTMETTTMETTMEPTTVEPTTVCPPVEGSLYFQLNGVTYPSGSTIPLRDVGFYNPASGVSIPDSSLVCVTSELNTQCCRNSDGGNVGEWFFPDGSIVPRRSGNPNADFVRSGYIHEVRLSRMNDATEPYGTYTCMVPRQDGCEGLMHTAVITLDIPMPTFARCFCSVCVWNPPLGSFESVDGYDVRYTVVDTPTQLVLTLSEREFYQESTQEIRGLGPEHMIKVQVRVRLTEDVNGPWTESVSLCPAS